MESGEGRTLEVPGAEETGQKCADAFSCTILSGKSEK